MRRRYWVPVQQRSPAYCVAPGHEAELTRLSRTRSLRCRVRRRRNLEFLLQQSGLLGIDPNREDETAVLAHRLRHHLGVTVEPAHSGAVRRIEHEIEAEPVRRDARLERGEQGIDPLPGRCGYQNGPGLRAPFGQVDHLDAPLRVQKNDLVPGLD